MKDEAKDATEQGLTRRLFIKGGAGAVLAASCLPMLRANAVGLKTRAETSAVAKVYVCPPCGQPCDKLTFDKPGTCPQCAMTLVPADGEGGPPVVAILLFNGAELIDFAGPWEVFGTAGFLVHTVAEKQEPLTMVFGQKVIPDHTFDNSPKADILLVPGGGFGEPSENPRTIQWIQSKAKEVSHVMSVCTGAFIIGKAGLLNGQTATATYGMVDDLLTFPNTKAVYDQRFVDNGKMITTAGLSSGIDGALHLVSKILGRGNAQAVALGMEYNWDPDSKWARGALANRYLPDGLAGGRGRIKGAESELLSTEGNADRWEARILVSSPNSASGIMDLLGKRIAATTASAGMSNPIRHIRGPVRLSSPTANNSEIGWKLTDDQGRNWTGLAVVMPGPDDKNKFLVTFKLSRDGTSA